MGEAKVKFDKDMAAFIEGGGEKTKDPNAPKKPSGGGYGIYLAENRAKIVKSLPAGHKITDVTKAAGEQWRALSDAWKTPFTNKFLKKQEEYQAALAEYKKNLPEDAEEEDEEDEEDDEEDEEEEEEKEAAPPSKKARKGNA